jgi:hypothetical protein
VVRRSPRGDVRVSGRLRNELALRQLHSLTHSGEGDAYAVCRCALFTLDTGEFRAFEHGAHSAAATAAASQKEWLDSQGKHAAALLSLAAAGEDAPCVVPVAPRPMAAAPSPGACCATCLPRDSAAYSGAKVTNRNGGISAGRSLTRPFRDARRFPSTRIVARTEGYAYAAKVWDLSLVQGAVSAPRAKPNRSDSQLLHRCTGAGQGAAGRADTSADADLAMAMALQAEFEEEDTARAKREADQERRRRATMQHEAARRLVRSLAVTRVRRVGAHCTRGLGTLGTLQQCVPDDHQVLFALVLTRTRGRL